MCTVIEFCDVFVELKEWKGDVAIGASVHAADVIGLVFVLGEDDEPAMRVQVRFREPRPYYLPAQANVPMHQILVRPPSSVFELAHAHAKRRS
jgi:hypothetical protein